MNITKRHIWIVLFLLYMAAVAYLCFMKPDDIPEISPDLWGIPIDKAAHFLMFFPYTIIAYGAFRPFRDRTLNHILILSAVFAAGVGIAIGTEYLQGISEYRSYDIKDFYADLIGISSSAAMVLVYILLRHKLHRHE